MSVETEARWFCWWTLCKSSSDCYFFLMKKEARRAAERQWRRDGEVSVERVMDGLEKYGTAAGQH